MLIRSKTCKYVKKKIAVIFKLLLKHNYSYSNALSNLQIKQPVIMYNYALLFPPYEYLSADVLSADVLSSDVLSFASVLSSDVLSFYVLRLVHILHNNRLSTRKNNKMQRDRS